MTDRRWNRRPPRRRWRRWLLFWEPGALVRDAERRLLAGDVDEARRLLERARERAPDWTEPCYLLGRCASQEGDRDREESWYREALARDPGHARAEEGLLAVRAWRYRPLMEAWHLYHAGSQAPALGAFRAARAEVGGRVPASLLPEILAGEGWCHYELRDMPAARDAFAAALGGEGKLIHAQKGLGLALYWLGELDAAEEALQRALELQPDLDDARAFLGWCAYGRGAWVDARQRFVKAREANPLAGDPRWGVAWCELRLGRHEEAVVSFQDALERDATHPSRSDLVGWACRDARYAVLLLPMARRLVEIGRPAEALPLFDHAPPGAATHEVTGLRALALLRTGREAEVRAVLAALPDEERDLSLEEGWTDTTGEVVRVPVTPRQLGARAALAAGDARGARAVLEEVLVREELASARWDLARACLALGDLDEARDAFVRARRASPLAARAERGLQEVVRRSQEPLLRALETFRKGRYGEVLEILRDAEGLPPGDRWRAALLRGRSLLAEGRPQEALEVLEEACHEVPDHPEPVLCRARLLALLGRARDGLELVEANLDRNPDHVDLLSAGAELAGMVGHRRRARRLRSRARSLAPGTDGRWLPREPGSGEAPPADDGGTV